MCLEEPSGDGIIQASRGYSPGSLLTYLFLSAMKANEVSLVEGWSGVLEFLFIISLLIHLRMLKVSRLVAPWPSCWGFSTGKSHRLYECYIISLADRHSIREELGCARAINMTL